MERVIENFLKYVKIDTESAEGSASTPSTQKQHDLAEALASQLEGMGAEEIVYDRERCYVYASIPASKGCADAPVFRADRPYGYFSCGFGGWGEASYHRRL